MKKEIFKSFDGTELVCQLWDEVEAPKGVVQLSHGMAEHIERYNEISCSDKYRSCPAQELPDLFYCWSKTH